MTEEQARMESSEFQARAITRRAERGLALTFAADVRASLSPEQLADVNRLNKRDKDLPVCHTHDYYDANESMIAAFEQTFGRDADPGSNADADLINKAWSLAKNIGFTILT